MSASRNRSVFVNQNRIIMKRPTTNSLKTNKNAQKAKVKYLRGKSEVNFLEIRNRFEIFTNEDTPHFEYEDKIKPMEDVTILTRKSKKHSKRSKYSTKKIRAIESYSTSSQKLFDVSSVLFHIFPSLKYVLNRRNKKRQYH